ncbi:uncharacterized protein JCM10292_001018 [Rhodotorula paludigena]|uniref:uncharacterized protein n=1 Tax=Rhodotorula paludigena TaxID=86838 RepID=UPI00318009AF
MPATPRRASASLDLRLDTTPTRPSSPGFRSPAGVTEPLLPRSYSSGASLPSSPARNLFAISTSAGSPPSPGGSVRSGSHSPTAAGQAQLYPIAAALPKAGRLSSPRRWAVLVGVALFLTVVTLGTRGGGDEGYAASLHEGLRAGVEGVKGWTWAGSAAQADVETIALDEDRPQSQVEADTEDLPAEGSAHEELGNDAPGRTGNVEPAEPPDTADQAGETDEERVMEETLEAAAAPEDETQEGEELEVLPATPTINVNPTPRPPPRERQRETRYLAFHPHSGFHNQRKSLVNALTLAELLNRTLLLPPARLGLPVPWEADPKIRTPVSEGCKAGTSDVPVAAVANSHAVATGEECDDPARWTYTGWDWLVSPGLLQDRALVDRWNTSQAWLTAPVAEGGLAFQADEIHVFPDVDRRSYQILDSPNTPLDKGMFSSRIELDDLRDEAGLGSKRLLQFGSLFSGARLKLTEPDNTAMHTALYDQVVLQNEGLDAISDRIRDQLGSYIAAHARVGDGNFKRDAVKNMQKVFRSLCHDTLGLSNVEINVLLDEVTASASHKSAPQGKAKAMAPAKKVARSFGSKAAADLVVRTEFSGGRGWEPEDAFDEADLLLDGDHTLSSSSAPLFRSVPSATSAISRRAIKGEPSQPLAQNLHCRRPLHDVESAPHLAPLNVPLYIATDSRSPTTDASLAPFNRWFPCVFFLSDFAAASEVNDSPVEELAELVAAKSAEEAGGLGGRWTSDWDGQAMAKYLYPFLEAEIAARAVEVVGTPASTFSGYVRGLLHQAYVRRGMAATWRR